MVDGCETARLQECHVLTKEKAETQDKQKGLHTKLTNVESKLATDQKNKLQHESITSEDKTNKTKTEPEISKLAAALSRTTNQIKNKSV